MTISFEYVIFYFSNLCRNISVIKLRVANAKPLPSNPKPINKISLTLNIWMIQLKSTKVKMNHCKWLE